MPKLRHSVTSRYYEPDDEDPRPRRRRKKSDPMRELGIIALVAIVIYLIYKATTGH